MPGPRPATGASPALSSHIPLKSTPAGGTALFGKSAGAVDPHPCRTSKTIAAAVKYLTIFPEFMPAEILSTE